MCMVLFILGSWFIHCLLILLSVAFFTLFERKVMGLFHSRTGPNKLLFIGVIQPLLDAFKLLSKQNLVPYRSNKLFYSSAPQLSLFLSMFVWLMMPMFFSFLLINFSFILFFCISSVMVFCVLFAGWSSNSKYSLIGSLRSVAQSISYESVMSTLTAFLCIVGFSYSIGSFFMFYGILLFLVMPLWFICILAETHRAPFDFSEAESELVSGFNTEYSGAYFAFIFLSEYGVLLFSCLFMSCIFFSFILKGVGLFILISLLFSFIFIWVRITFCRFRYDLLMMVAWKSFLPFSLYIFSVILYLI